MVASKLCQRCHLRKAKRSGYCGNICYQSAYYKNVTKAKRSRRKRDARYREKNKIKLQIKDRQRYATRIKLVTEYGEYLDGFGPLTRGMRHLSGWEEDEAQDRILANLEAQK